MSFNQFILKEQHAQVQGWGDRLESMKEQIDWWATPHQRSHCCENHAFAIMVRPF